VTICVFALAILERDGLWVLIGACATAISFAIAWGVLYALLRSVLALISRLLG
jgi:hypothetical protein